MIEAIRLDLKKLKRPGRLLPGAVEAGIAIRNPWRNASLIHWGIDGCVTAAILAPVLLRFAF
jgi:hypothetical protein